MSSNNRKEQIFNSAGGLAANLFEKFNKLKHQQSNNESSSSSPPTSSSSPLNLTIGFHKTNTNNQSNQLNNPNLLIINDDGFDDTNIDPLNEITLNKQPLIKSKSVNTSNPISSTSNKQIISQSQSDYDLNNNNNNSNSNSNLIISSNNNSNNSSLTPSVSGVSKMTSSSSLFKLSSGFIDDLKTDIINKTNSYVDEAEDALRRRFQLKKKKSTDSIHLNPTHLSSVSSPPSNSSTPSTPLVETNDSNLTEYKLDEKQQINETKTDQIEPLNEEIISEQVDVAKQNNSIVTTTSNETQLHFDKNLFVWFPICLSILICLLIKLLNATNSSFLSIILFYSCGFLTGSLIVSLLIGFILIKYNLIKLKTDQTEFKLLNNDKQKNDQLHSLLIQTAMHKQNKNFDGVHKGWMNELREKYDPDTYFLNKTRSVFVSLDGTILRLQTTTSKIPKRAVYNEKIGYVQFNDQRIYDLTDCECFLLPKELVRKRFWSKKYPLCLKGVKLQKSFVSRKQSMSQSVSTNNIDSNTDDNNNSLQLDDSTLILFARTDREKEEWFKLFKKSSAKKLIESSVYLNQKKSTSISKPLNSSSKLVTSSTNDSTTGVSTTSASIVSYDTTNDKLIYKLVNELDTLTTDNSNNTASNIDNSESNLINERDTQTENGLLYDTSLNFMNTFLIRMFNDFFTHKFWIDKIRTKMQNKLNTLKTPYFMEDLKIIDLDLGFMIPLIKQTSEPWYDDKGLWCHLDIDYSGGIQILISTKLNLMKLKSNEQDGGQLEEERRQKHEQQQLNSKRLHLGMINSDEEDSAESSGDEYVHTDNTDTGEVVETANKGKKILNIVNKIAASNYFQKATEMKYIKKAMENVSNCQLLLNVEVKKIAGTLALNIPPHPSDRIWYGFASTPQMVLIATPQVGDKEVSYSAISDWIAEKLKQEFQKVLVFPNMDDFYLPILNSEIEYKNW